VKLTTVCTASMHTKQHNNHLTALSCSGLEKPPLTLHVNITPSASRTVVKSYSGIWLWCLWAGVDIPSACHPLAQGADSSNSDVTHPGSTVQLPICVIVDALALQGLVRADAGRLEGTRNWLWRCHFGAGGHCGSQPWPTLQGQLAECQVPAVGDVHSQRQGRDCSAANTRTSDVNSQPQHGHLPLLLGCSTAWVGVPHLSHYRCATAA
jgi:hypothetical protein